MPQNAGRKLVDAIRKQIEKIIYFCTVENVSPNLAVHEMRKSFKRLRALLRFYIDFPEEFSPDYSQQIKYFGKSLSTLRESFVNIQIFERIATNNNLIAERKIKGAKEKLIEENKAIIENSFFVVEGCQSIHRFIEVLDGQVGKIEIERPSQHQLVGQLVDSYRQAYDCYQQIMPGSDAEEMHKLRKKLKRLWYQFDFIKYLHPRFFRLKSDQLNKMTEQLGEDHDLFVFSNELKWDKTDFTASEVEIIKNQVQHLREINMLKLLPRLKQFFNDSTETYNRKLESIFKVSLV